MVLVVDPVLDPNNTPKKGCDVDDPRNNLDFDDSFEYQQTKKQKENKQSTVIHTPLEGGRGWIMKEDDGGKKWTLISWYFDILNSTLWQDV